MNDKTIDLLDDSLSIPESDLTDVVKKPMEQNISPEVIAAIKAQVIEEMQNDSTRKAEEERIRREKERKEHDEYIAKMKASPDPWVELEGWSDTNAGVKIELEWNDAFIEALKQSGFSGSDEDQIVQKWLIVIMRDLSEQVNTDDSEYK